MSSSWLEPLIAFAGLHGPAVRVVVIRAEGSTPREPGASMLVACNAIDGTIGGGALEHAAIEEARRLLGGGEGEGSWPRRVRDFPLGPELRQCCGGFVSVLFETFASQEMAHVRSLHEGLGNSRGALIVRPVAGGMPLAVATSRRETHDWPLHVLMATRAMLSGARPAEPTTIDTGNGIPAWLIEPVARRRHLLHLYGAGHVGRALVKALADLPFDIVWVDTSAERFPGDNPARVRIVAAPEPARVAREAPTGATHIVMTYSHSLDFEICRVLLARNDFLHLGLIGSRTKRARFLKRLSEAGIAPAALARLECPIGIAGITGKEPAMIAVSVAAGLVGLVTNVTVREVRESNHGQ